MTLKIFEHTAERAKPRTARLWAMKFAGARLAVRGLVLGLAFWASYAFCEETPPAEPQPAVENRATSVPHAKRAVVIRFDRPISRGSEMYFHRKLEQAQQDKADLIILEIDSPGGGLAETEHMADALLNIDWAHIVAYIPREAISGAALLSLACDEIVLRPNAVIGDAGVIFMDQEFNFRFAEPKIVSEVVTRARMFAEATGRPPALAEAMVDRDAVVYRVKNRQTGEVRLMNDADIQGSDVPDDWEKLHMIAETQEDRFLHVSGQRALALGLADAVVADQQALFDRYGFDQPVATYRWTGMDSAAAILNHPAMTFLLLVVGVISLGIELAVPGMGAGGLVAVLCFVSFFWSRFLGGTADWLEVIMFGMGMALMMVELFILPGFGIWGVTGLLLMLASIVLAGQEFVIPADAADWRTLRTSVGTVILAGCVVGAVGIFLASHMASIPGLSRFTLKPPVETSTGTSTTRLAAGHGHITVQVGDRGTAETPLRPAGVVIFGDDSVDVVTHGTFVEAGRPVVVIEVTGNRVVVREVSGH